jgi:hypothetical protein
MVDGHWKTLGEAEKARDAYDAKIDEYRKRLRDRSNKKKSST